MGNVEIMDAILVFIVVLLFCGLLDSIDKFLGKFFYKPENTLDKEKIKEILLKNCKVENNNMILLDAEIKYNGFDNKDFINILKPENNLKVLHFNIKSNNSLLNRCYIYAIKTKYFLSISLSFNYPGTIPEAIETIDVLSELLEDPVKLIPYSEEKWKTLYNIVKGENNG